MEKSEKIVIGMKVEAIRFGKRLITRDVGVEIDATLFYSDGSTKVEKVKLFEGDSLIIGDCEPTLQLDVCRTSSSPRSLR